MITFEFRYLMVVIGKIPVSMATQLLRRKRYGAIEKLVKRELDI